MVPHAPAPKRTGGAEITLRRHGQPRCEQASWWSRSHPLGSRQLRRPSSAATEGGRFAFPAPLRCARRATQARLERCPSGRRSATGNRVWAERSIAGSNPALSVSSARRVATNGGARRASAAPLHCLPRGGVAERSNAAVSKTVIRLNGGSRVQIPPPPLYNDREADALRLSTLAIRLAATCSSPPRSLLPCPAQSPPATPLHTITLPELTASLHLIEGSGRGRGRTMSEHRRCGSRSPQCRHRRPAARRALSAPRRPRHPLQPAGALVAELALRALGAVDEQAAVGADIGLPALRARVLRSALDAFEDDDGHLVVLRLRRQQELLGGRRNCANLADRRAPGNPVVRNLRTIRSRLAA